MWKLRKIDLTGFDACPRLEPGDVAYAPWMADFAMGATYATKDCLVRLPIVIGVPSSEWHKEHFGADIWYPDMAASNGRGDGWQIQNADDLENLTITPSINFTGSYHGWVSSGFVTDDCEGRTFPHWPERIKEQS